MDNATTHLNDEQDVIEHGPPTPDRHYGQKIPAYIITGGGIKYDFNRLAKEGDDGLVDLAQLGPNECVIAPGLIYRRV